MIALFLIPLFLALSAYLYSWLIRWLSAISPFFRKKPVMIAIAVIMFICTANVFTSYLFEPQGFGRLLKQFCYTWMAICMYALMIVAIADLIRVIIKIVRKKKGMGGFSRSTKILAGVICLVLTAGVLVYGFVNARIVRTTSYDVAVDKDAGDMTDLNVVLVADLHMGINIGVDHIQKTVDAINALEPDIVVVAGDIFDNEYDALDDEEELIRILSSIQSKYGVYCVFGNHDIEEKLLCGFTFNFHSVKKADPRMESFIDKCGWIWLNDETVTIADSIYLAGRPDYRKPGEFIIQRKSPEEITSGLDQSKPIIVFEHEPVELDKLANAGVDVELAGHTHDGQFFPMNITNRIIWENGYGYLNKNGMHSIVTSGAGLYGPYLRVCTIAEVTQVNIHFSGN